MAIRLDIVSQFDSKGIKKAQRELQGVARNITRAFDVAVAGAIAGVAVGLGKATKAAVEDQKSQALLATQLRNTVAASDAQIASVEQSISKMQLQASVADDEIRPAFASLVRATGDVTKATGLTSLALDVAAGTGKSLSSVSLALGKAVNGSSTALVKLVPSIKGASSPLAELDKQFKGAAESAADADPYQRLQIIFGEIQEQVGAELVPILQEFAAYLASDAGQAELKQYVEIFKDIAIAAGDALKFIAANRDTIIKFGELALILYGVSKAWGALKIAIDLVVVSLSLVTGRATIAGILGIGTAATTASVGVQTLATRLAPIVAASAALATLFAVLSLGGDSAKSGTGAAPKKGNVAPNSGLLPKASNGLPSLKNETAQISKGAKAVQDQIAGYEKARQQVSLTAQATDSYADILKSLDSQTAKTTKTQGANTDAVKKSKAAQEANSKARVKYWEDLVKTRELLQAQAEAEQELQNQLIETRKELLAATAGMGALFKAQVDVGEFESRVVDSFSNVKDVIKSALADGKITGDAASSLNLLATSTEASLRAMGKQLDQLTAKRKAAQDLFDDVKGSILGSGQLTGLMETQSRQVTKTVTSIVNGLQVAVSSTTEEITSGGLINNFKKVLDKTKAFAEQLKTLRKLGLDQNLFKQIVDAGADAGGAIASEIIAGGADSITEINQVYKDLAEVSGNIAEQTAVVFFNDGKDVVGGLVNGLLAQEQQLVDAATTLANAFLTTFEQMIANLKVPSSTTTVGAAAMNMYDVAKNLAGSMDNYYSSSESINQARIAQRNNAPITVVVNAGVGTNGKAVGQAIQTELNKFAKSNA